MTPRDPSARNPAARTSVGEVIEIEDIAAPGRPGRDRGVRGLERRRRRGLVGRRPPDEVWDAHGGRGHRPRGLLRLPGQPARRRHRRGRPPPDHLAVDPDRGRLAARTRPRRHPDPRHRAEHALAAVLRRAAGRLRRARRRAGGHARRPAGRHARTPGRSRSPAPPPSPSSWTGSSSSSRRTRGRPGSSASSRTPACGWTSRRCRYWAAVPHYVAQPPCPKATLALLGQIEDLLEISIPLGDLPEDARAWERGVDELAEEDEDVADYVRALEETRDTTDLPEASRRGDRPGVRALPQAARAADD